MRNAQLDLPVVAPHHLPRLKPLESHARLASLCHSSMDSTDVRLACMFSKVLFVWRAPLFTKGPIRCPDWRRGPSGAPRAVVCSRCPFFVYSRQFNIEWRKNVTACILLHQSKPMSDVCSSLCDVLQQLIFHYGRSQALWAFIAEAPATEWLQLYNIKNGAISAMLNARGVNYIVEDLARTGPLRVACTLPVWQNWQSRRSCLSPLPDSVSPQSCKAIIGHVAFIRCNKADIYLGKSSSSGCNHSRCRGSSVRKRVNRTPV